MSVHHTVTPAVKGTGTHSYTWVNGVKVEQIESILKNLQSEFLTARPSRLLCTYMVFLNV